MGDTISKQVLMSPIRKVAKYKLACKPSNKWFIHFIYYASLAEK